MVLPAGGIASTRHFLPAAGNANSAVIYVALSVNPLVCAGGTANSAPAALSVML